MQRRPGWNPGRRNRHVGTRAHGHGADNRLTIPGSSRDWVAYFEKLANPVTVCRQIGQRELRFVVEPTRPDWFYPCTVDAICAVLSHCDAEVLSAFDFVVMRQATRKQRILSPVWGRAVFSYDLGKLNGPAIVIESQNLDPIRWGRSVDPEDARELERLRADGHAVHTTRRGTEVRVSAESLRNTVLYRTLLHEIGHHMDGLRCPVEDRSGRTRAMKEDFAHRFAQVLGAHLAAQGALPFPPIIDNDSLIRDGLAREWFCPDE